MLIRQLLGALQDNGIEPDADRVDEVRAIGPKAVSRTVLSRLARMPESTVVVARAAAILGEQPGLPALAAVAGTDEGEAADAVARLARADILRAEGPLGFVHPLVRDAVYSEVPAAALGGSAAYIRGPAGVEPLEQAYAGLADPITRARAAIRLSHLLLFVRSPQEGVSVAKRAMAELPDGHDDLRDGLRAIRLIGVQFGASDPEARTTLEAVRWGPRGSGPEPAR